MNILFGSLRFVVNISFALSMLLAVLQCHKWKMWLQTVWVNKQRFCFFAKLHTQHSWSCYYTMTPRLQLVIIFISRDELIFLISQNETQDVLFVLRNNPKPVQWSLYGPRSLSGFPLQKCCSWIHCSWRRSLEECMILIHTVILLGGEPIPLPLSAS